MNNKILAKSTLIGFILVFILSCSIEQEDVVLNQDAIVGLAKPVKLKPGENKIRNENFFLQPDLIDSIVFSEEVEIKVSPDKKFVSFIAGANLPTYSTLACYVNGEPYSILLEKSRKQNYKLIFDPNGNDYQKVQVKGSMNDWNPEDSNMNLVDGKWEIDFVLNPGKYHYQFVVDGEPILDPNNPVKEDNNIGGFNSVLWVGKMEKKNSPKLQTTFFTDENIHIKLLNGIEKIHAFWQNYSLAGRQLKVTEKEIIVSIPKEARQRKRSWIRVFTFNKTGKGNDILIPLENGKVVESTARLDRFDKETSILYFMMVDRFLNGNQENDSKVNDPEVASRANYHGGDIAGILKQFDEGYFDELGVNTLWLSPIVQNTRGSFVEYPEPHRKFTGYHGYWPISLIKIDSRFGSDNDLNQLVSKAHNNNMNILLDFISNHVHENSSLYRNHPDWVTQLNLPDGSQNIRKWDEQRLTTWFDTFLPSLDHDQEAVREYVTDSAVYWVEKFGIDGFRHDATKHIPMSFWHAFTKKMNTLSAEQGKRLYQVGETFGGRELIGSYVGSGKLDAQFDFNLFWDARSVFAIDEESFEKLNNSIFETFDYYGYNHLMGNVTGNHDMPRFISFASGALAFDEDSQEAGWIREIKVEDPVGYKKLQSLMAFTMTIPGVPVIYYGDEIGIPGGGDPDNRRPMRFKNLSDNELRTKEITSQLIKLRKSSMALLFGDYNELYVSKDIYSYYRNYFGEIVILVFNRNSEMQKIEIEIPFEINMESAKGNFGNEWQINGQTLAISVQGNSFEIISGKH